jgi:hypothetical protein
MRSLIFTLVLLAAAPIAAQTAVRVGEYQGASGNRHRFPEIMGSFIERLEKEPKSTRGAIAFIGAFKFAGPCFGNHPSGDTEFERFVKKSLPTKYSRRVMIIPSEQWGLLEEAEFYLVPSGANPPRRIERIVDPPCCCPTIQIKGPREINGNFVNVRYELVLTPSSSKKRSKIRWTVAGGEIVSGQGSPKIRIRPDRVATEVVLRVSSDLGTICSCGQESSLTTKIIRK